MIAGVTHYFVTGPKGQTRRVAFDNNHLNEAIIFCGCNPYRLVARWNRYGGGVWHYRLDIPEMCQFRVIKWTDGKNWLVQINEKDGSYFPLRKLVGYTRRRIAS